MPTTKKDQDRAIRRLKAELGVESRTGAIGVLLGVGVVAVLAVLTASLTLPNGARTPVDGHVERVLYNASRNGGGTISRSWAQAYVTVGDRAGWVSLPYAAVCRQGDRIHLLRGHTILPGATFIAAPGQPCEHA